MGALKSLSRKYTLKKIRSNFILPCLLESGISITVRVNKIQIELLVLFYILK